MRAIAASSFRSLPAHWMSSTGAAKTYITARLRSLRSCLSLVFTLDPHSLNSPARPVAPFRASRCGMDAVVHPQHTRHVQATTGQADARRNEEQPQNTVARVGTS